MNHEHKWDFFMNMHGTMVYICEICGNVIPCCRTRKYDSLSDLKGAKVGNGYRFFDRG